MRKRGRPRKYVSTATSISSMAASMHELYGTNIPLSSTAGGAITVEGNQLKHLADGIALGVDTDVHRHVESLYSRAAAAEMVDGGESGGGGGGEGEGGGGEGEGGLERSTGAEWNGMSTRTRPEDDPWFVQPLPTMEEQRMAVLGMKSYPVRCVLIFY